MYTRKLTTKTRKGKRTMGKRVGKSVNKNRNNRNNNRRTKRAGNLLGLVDKYGKLPGVGETLELAGSAGAQGIRNVKAGYKIMKILKEPLPTDESSRKTELINRYNQIVPILKETLIGNLNVTKKTARAFVHTDKAKQNLGFNIRSAQFNPRNQAHAQLGQPGVYPRIV